MNTMEQSTGAGVFAARIARTLNNGFIALMISVGHRTGLFDVLASLPPSTSNQIAAAAGLSERYVREWLAAMTTAHIVDFDTRTLTYFLPIEYAAVLSRGAGVNNLAPAAQLFAYMASLEDLVVAGFHTGGGIVPEAYARLHEVLADDRRELIDESYVETILDLIPGMRLRLELGASVLDAGCGDGVLLGVMARMFPRSLFHGSDCSADAIERARDATAGLANVEWSVTPLTRLEERQAYDLVLAMESIHRQSFPRVVLRRLATALKPHGAMLMQEVEASSHLWRNIEHPFGPMLYAMSTMHAVPLALSDEGEALGMMWGKERASQMLVEAGFRGVKFEGVAADPLSYYAIASR